MAVGAKTCDLDDRGGHLKAKAFRSLEDAALDGVVAHLGHCAAVPAEEKLCSMGPFGMGAADKGVQAFNPVGQSLLHQELDGAIDCLRGQVPRTGGGVRIKAVKNIVRTGRAMVGPQQGQDPAAHIGKAGTALGAQGLGATQGVALASAVIMRGIGEGRVC